MELESVVKEIVGAIGIHPIALAYVKPAVRARDQLRVIAVIDDLEEGIRRVQKSMEEMKVEFLVVDRELFESDVNGSVLLELGACNLLLPYRAILGNSYLTQWGKSLKKRKLRESLTSLTLEHPELSSELLIDPRYFVHDILTRLSHILPEACDLIRNMNKGGDCPGGGYGDALRELEREGILHFVGCLVAIDRTFVDTVLSQRISPSDQLVWIQKQLLNILKLGIKGLTDLIRYVYDSSIESYTTSLKDSNLLNPNRFLHFPTETGLTSLSESTEIEAVIGRLVPSGRVKGIEMRRFGSFLNEVHLLTYDVEGTTRKAVVKRYPTWGSLKWAPLAIWTLGTQNFAISGRSRMERECATTSLLTRGGIKVPRILCTNFEDRLLLREYVEGGNLNDIVKAVIRGGGLSERERALLRRVGGILAAVHGAGVTLGDCKPENFINSPENDLFIVDLEQGARGGVEAWDVAEFLYFSGHFARPLDPLTGVAEMTRCFIGGYLDGGGERSNVSEAVKMRYSKVFTPITLLPVIRTIVKGCRAETE